MKHCCRKCHFLAKEHGRPGGILSSSFSWTKKERSEGKVDGSHWNICCKKGIWDEGIEPELISRLEEVIDKNRKDDCFFIEYAEGMSFEGATELHRIRYDNQHLKRSFSAAVWGLRIAAFAALLNFIGFDNFQKVALKIYEWITMLSSKFF